jgi:hypothetical protein
MTDDTDNTSTPPAVGELLPRAAEAFGVRSKLATYSLDITNKVGAAKARGFERILEITLKDIDYLEAEILAGVLKTPIREIRGNAPYGVNCVVDIPIRGLGTKSERVLPVLTAWQIIEPGEAPRLVTAYIKP